MSSLGYREMAAYLSGDLSLEEAVERIKTTTHRYARSQYAWFKLNDPRIQWLEADDEGLSENASRLIEDFLAELS